MWVKVPPSVADLAQEYIEPARRQCAACVDTVRQPLGHIGQRFEKSRSRPLVLGGIDVESEPLESPEKLFVFAQPVSQHQ